MPGATCTSAATWVGRRRALTKRLHHGRRHRCHLLRRIAAILLVTGARESLTRSRYIDLLLRSRRPTVSVIVILVVEASKAAWREGRR